MQLKRHQNNVILALMLLMLSCAAKKGLDWDKAVSWYSLNILFSMPLGDTAKMYDNLAQCLPASGCDVIDTSKAIQYVLANRCRVIMCTTTVSKLGYEVFHCNLVPLSEVTVINSRQATTVSIKNDSLSYAYKVVSLKQLTGEALGSNLGNEIKLVRVK
jgi:hypothetical protein